MSLTVYAFLIALASAALFFWRPGALAGHALRMLVFCGIGFLAVVFLLAGLFSLWWPPRFPGTVFWSIVSLLFLLAMMFRAEVEG